MTGVALALLRHGPTDWTQARLIQGRADRALSEEGRRAVAAWRLPSDVVGWRWVCSPLARARETAVLLGHPEAVPVPALIEMDWGAWEGRRLGDLRAEDPAGTAAREARGLDMRPPGGESPRAVQARLTPWLAEVAGSGEATVAVCHKGVIRALLALAIGWTMTAAPPEPPRDDALHRFRLDAAGRPRLERLNEPLLT
jgi:probable phosphoglycerate mutase